MGWHFCPGPGCPECGGGWAIERARYRQAVRRAQQARKDAGWSRWRRFKAWLND